MDKGGRLKMQDLHWQTNIVGVDNGRPANERFLRITNLRKPFYEVVRPKCICICSDCIFVKKVRVRMQIKKKIDVYSSSWNLRATEGHLPYGITQCYLPPDTGERAPP